MNTLSTDTDLTTVVRGLLEKYGQPTAPQLGSWRVLAERPTDQGKQCTLLPGWTLLNSEPCDTFVPVFPWRNERRFQELQRILTEGTLESLSMCRWAAMTDGAEMNLAAVLYREFDLVEWVTGSPIIAVQASIQAGRWANVILRLASGVVCGVEVGTTLPPGSAPIDRHELIAQRGVACDRVVDSQVPQNSIYTFTASGSAAYTDTDAELFGLPLDEVNLVRAAYETLTHVDRIDAFRRQHRRLVGLVQLAVESDRRIERLAAEGV